MTKLFTLMALVFICTFANAQSDTLIAPKQGDTIRIGNIIIIKKGGERNYDNTNIRMSRDHHRKLSNVSTNWGIVDLGFANYTDKTNYATAGSYLYNVNRPGNAPLGASDFKLNAGKSVNVNIWFFMQRLNLIKNHVNLKYGLGLELYNYRYKSAISYLEQNPFIPGQTPSPVIIRDSIKFTKNKLAADYVTVPIMLNFSTNPGEGNKGISLSAGISAGYLYSQRNKQESSERGKRKNKGDYDLERFKLSYVAELGLGPVRLYGTYTPQSIYSRGLDIRPYTLGVRLSNW